MTQTNETGLNQFGQRLPATPQARRIRMLKGVVVPNFTDLKIGDVITVPDHEAILLIGLNAAEACDADGQKMPEPTNTTRIRLKAPVVIQGFPNARPGDFLVVENSLARELIHFRQAELAPTLLQKVKSAVGL